MIKLALTKHQWAVFKTLMEMVAWYYPIEDYEVETCLIAEFYEQRIHGFTYFKPDKKGFMRWTIPFSIAFAVNMFYGDNSVEYNQILRQYIEPKLPGGKPMGGINGVLAK